MARPVDSAASEIAIDRNADVPVGVQLEWALCAQIRDGRLAPGEQLPTLREMAEASGLNVNTVRAVYRRLEQKGLIDSQQGSGTFVAGAPRHADAVSSIAANAASEARETGLDPRDVAAALYVAPDAAERKSAAAADEDEVAQSPATRRRALRDQIAALERTVAELEAEHPGVAPVPARARRGIGPALLTLEELAHVRATLIRRLTVVQSAIDEHLDAQRRESPRASDVAKAKAKAAAPARKASRKPAKAAQPPDAPERPARPRLSPRPAPAGG